MEEIGHIDIKDLSDATLLVITLVFCPLVSTYCNKEYKIDLTVIS